MRCRSEAIETIICITLLSFAILFTLSFDCLSVNLIDEGFFCLGAWKILHGGVLYKDYVAAYTPVTFYLLAFVYRLFGATVFSGRFFMALLNGLSAVIVYKLTRRLVSSFLAVISGILFVFYCAPYSMGPTGISIITSLIALFLLTKYLVERREFWLWGSSIFLGVTILTKQNIGGILAITLLLFLMVGKVLGHRFEITAISKKDFLILTAGSIGVVSGVLTLFYLNGSLNDFVYNTVIYNYETFVSGTDQSLHIPPPSIFPLSTLLSPGQYPSTRFLFYLGLSIWFGLTIILLYRIISKSIDRTNPFLLLYLIFAIFSLLSIFPIFDYGYLVPFLAVSIILGCYLLNLVYRFLNSKLDKVSEYSWTLKRRSLFHTMMSLLLIIILALPFYPLIIVRSYSHFQFVSRESDFLQKYGLSVTPYVEPTLEGKSAILEVVEFIKMNTEKEDKILSLPFHPMINFLAERDAPTKYSQFLPHTTSPEIEKDVTRDIEKENVEYVVYFCSPNHQIIRGKIFNRYAEVLYDYLVDNFHVERGLSDDVVIMKRDSDQSGKLWEQIRKGEGSVDYNGYFIPSEGLCSTEIGPLEDGSYQTYLYLHPGFHVTYWNFTVYIPENIEKAELKLYFGFRKGANETDGVEFSSYVNGEKIMSSRKRYDGKLGMLVFDLSKYKGEIVEISLALHPIGSNSYDWAVWVPTITFGENVPK